MSVLLVSMLACLIGQQAEGTGTSPAASSNQVKPDPAWKPLGRSLWYDPHAKRLIIEARVVLREGQLEHLLCLKGTKEHEAILATDAQPYQIHAGLMLTGAKPGHPVRFLPKFEPPAGTPLVIELIWNGAGKTQRTRAQQWVKDEKTKKPLAIDWVFAGSDLFVDPTTKKTVYAADDGDLITVANFGSSILDLPIASSASDAERVFSANTEQIPPNGTQVWMVVGPQAKDPVNKP
jgi:hypothetical protein